MPHKNVIAMIPRMPETNTFLHIILYYFNMKDIYCNLKMFAAYYFKISHIQSFIMLININYFLICPLPYIIYFIVVNSFNPIGPLAWSF